MLINMFQETQSFRQWWLFIIMLSPHAIFLTGIYKQVVLHQQFGQNPASTGLLIGVEIFLILLSLFMFTMRLETRIDAQGIHAKFPPIFNRERTYVWTDVKSAYVREYNPLMEYGGWGFRSSMKGNGNAWNVSGNKGLQIEMIDGKKFMIGTQKPEELSAVLSQFNKK
jgi:hypothetical protein